MHGSLVIYTMVQELGRLSLRFTFEKIRLFLFLQGSAGARQLLNEGCVKFDSTR